MDDKPYMLFTFSTYYPRGGWTDYVDSFATLEEAQAEGIRAQNGSYCDWYQVVDARTREKLIDA